MTSTLDVLATLAAVAIIALIAKFAYLMKTRWMIQAALKDFPEHPRGIFFLGHAKAFMDGARGMQANFDVIYENNEKALQVWITPFNPAVLVYHPDTMKEVFNRADPKTFAYDPMRPWIGDGLLVSSGKKWARNRRLLTPAFHFDIIKPYVKAFVESTHNLAIKWKDSYHKDTASSTEVMHDISLATLESLLKCVMGVEGDSIQTG
ncbi:ultra-long-chain fatty acid omega-hydroxylase-like [Amphiura filiformis]|uniref:ultra-long-chain fatty acid omega-hydroxylase-like n=1 Tax=Amphiura filiformis TaxID=82378 RepID=UPI003B228E04